MTTIAITFEQTDGTQRVLENLPVGGTLMEAARDAGIAGILADCGGACDCGTCHVYVDPEWVDRVGPPNDIEIDTMDLMVRTVLEGRSRLSCQIALTAELDGLKVMVAPS